MRPPIASPHHAPPPLATRLMPELLAAILLSVASCAEYIGLGTQATSSLPGSQAVALGAMMGVLTAVVGLIGIALGGSIQPLISGPRVAATVLFSNLLATLAAQPRLAAHGLPALLGCAALAVAVAAITQLLLAAFKAGTLARMVPAPVFSGLLFGAAALAIESQVQTVTHCALEWPPTLVVIAAGLAAHFGWVYGVGFAARRGYSLPKGLSLFWTLLAGSAAYYAVLGFAPPAADCRTLGISGFDPGGIGSGAVERWTHTFSLLDGAILAQIGVYGALIGVLASLDTLIAIANIESSTHARAKPNRDLLMHGVLNLLCAGAGLLPVVGSLTRTNMALAAGARTRWTAILHALLTLALILFCSRLLSYVPKLAAAGVMIAMALDMLDDWSKLITRLTFSDMQPRQVVAAAMWLFVTVALVTIVTGEPSDGFAAGCALGVLPLLWPPRGLEVRIEVHPARIDVGLGGALLGHVVDRKVCEPLLARVVAEPGCTAIEFDLRALQRVDLSACKALIQFEALLRARGVAVLYRLKPDSPAGATFAAIRGDQAPPASFVDVDVDAGNAGQPGNILHMN
jgi:MFS superfamily sulfate permease-like transporter